MAEKMKATINSMLGDIINTPLDPLSTRLFVVFNSIKYAGLNPNDTIHDTTLLYQMGRSADGTHNVIADSVLIDNSKYYQQENLEGKWVLQRPQQLAEILRLTKREKDEEIMLATWDHGSAFGIFRVMPAVFQTNDVRKGISENLPQYPFIKEFWDAIAERHIRAIAERQSLPGLFITIQAGSRLLKVKNDEATLATINYHMLHKSTFRYHKEENKIRFKSTGKAGRHAGITDVLDTSPEVSEILKNSELQVAIQLWLNDKEQKVGVLLMNNCWMMNFHTMYALKESVSYLVAPQGNIDSPGYNTKDILQYIVSQLPEPADLAAVCVETLGNAYSKAKSLMLCPDDPDVLDRFKIFAANLGKCTPNNKLVIDEQVDQLRKIAQSLIPQKDQSGQPYPEIKYILKYVRSVCFEFTGQNAMLIDLVNWMQSVVFARDLLNVSEIVFPGEIRVPMVRFVDFCSDPKNSVMLKSSVGSRIYLNDEGAGPNQQQILPVIGLEPTGYGIFFPLTDCSDDTKLRDNVKTDQLLQDFPEWKILLSFIDPDAGKIFQARLL